MARFTITLASIMASAYAMQKRLQEYSDFFERQYTLRWLATFVFSFFYIVQLATSGSFLMYFGHAAIFFFFVHLLSLTLYSLVYLLPSCGIQRDDPNLPVSVNPPIIPPLFSEFRIWNGVNSHIFVLHPMVFITSYNPDHFRPWLKYFFFSGYLCLCSWVYRGVEKLKAYEAQGHFRQD